MRFIDKLLEHHIAALGSVTALVAAVNVCEVHGVVAVIVVTRCVLHNRCDPDGCKAKGLDVVELVDNALEIASPTRVACINLTLFVIPTQHVVFGITIVETGGNHEINTLIAKICSLTVKVVRHYWHGDKHKQK